MRLFSKAAVLGGVGVLLLGTSLALSSQTPAHGEQAHPDKKSCSKSTACLKETNNGTGSAIEGIASGAAANHSDGALMGIASASNGLNGLYAAAADNSGAWIENATSGYYTLYVESDASGGGYPLAAVNTSNGTEFYLDPEADGIFSGYVEASNYYTDVATRGGPHVGAFASTATRATLEDTGTSRLHDGEAAVRFAPAFARAIDASRGYQVFLTPGGDTRGLYVSAKYEGGFIVRETEHGRSSIAFDYRVVARPFGASDAMLPALPNKVRSLDRIFGNRTPSR